MAASGAVPGDPTASFDRRFTSTGATNQSGYSSARMDFVLANGRKAAQPKARAVYYRVAQQMIHDDRPLIILYSPVTFAAVSTNVTGVELTNAGLLIVANARFR